MLRGGASLGVSAAAASLELDLVATVPPEGGLDPPEGVADLLGGGFATDEACVRLRVVGGEGERRDDSAESPQPRRSLDSACYHMLGHNVLAG